MVNLTIDTLIGLSQRNITQTNSDYSISVNVFLIPSTCYSDRNGGQNFPALLALSFMLSLSPSIAEYATKDLSWGLPCSVSALSQTLRNHNTHPRPIENGLMSLAYPSSISFILLRTTQVFSLLDIHNILCFLL